MRIHALTTGTEATRILNELARLLDGQPGATVDRVDERTLSIESDQARVGQERADVEHLLVAISPTWPIHVRIED